MSARGQLKNRRMLVKLLDGTKFVDVFVDQTSRYIVFAEYGRVRRDQMKKMSPYVRESYVWVNPDDREGFDQEQAKEFPNLCPIISWDFAHSVRVPCRKLLDAHGCCPVHKKVRFTPMEAARAHKERAPRRRPALRKEPPRRRPNGKTTARMMHLKKVLYL